jgi:serine-aspartate repeat-containing protein C/D/E
MDSGETRVTTDASGNYKFTGLAAGTYKIREVLPTGWQQTTPASNFGINATVSSGQAVTGKNFGARPTPAGTASIAGTVFHDFNRNALRDTGDTGISAWLVYVDSNNNGVLDTNEQRMLTDSSGNYRFVNLAAGTYKVREVLQSGFIQTTPSSNFGKSVTVTSGQAASGANFGVDN